MDEQQCVTMSVNKNKKCTLLSRSIQCKHCSLAEKTLIRWQKRKKLADRVTKSNSKFSSSYIRNLNKRLTRRERKVKILTTQNRVLKQELENAHKKMENMDLPAVVQHLQDKNTQTTAGINWSDFKSKHKSPKSNRYGEDWMLLCMLLHMRSASGYEFLRSSKVLPLPAISTIRK